MHLIQERYQKKKKNAAQLWQTDRQLLLLRYRGKKNPKKTDRVASETLDGGFATVSNRLHSQRSSTVRRGKKKVNLE